MKTIWNWFGTKRNLRYPAIILISLLLFAVFPYHPTFWWRLITFVCGFVTGLTIIIWSNIRMFTWPKAVTLFVVLGVIVEILIFGEMLFVIYLGVLMPLSVSHFSLRLISYGCGLFVGIITSFIPKRIENKKNLGEGK